MGNFQDFPGREDLLCRLEPLPVKCSEVAFGALKTVKAPAVLQAFPYLLKTILLHFVFSVVSLALND